MAYIFFDSGRESLPFSMEGKSSSKSGTSASLMATPRPGNSSLSFFCLSSHPQSSTTAWTSLSIPVAFVSLAILSPSPLEFFSDTSYGGV